MKRELTEEMKKKFKEAFDKADTTGKAKLLVDVLAYTDPEELIRLKGLVNDNADTKPRAFDCDRCNNSGRNCEDTCDGFGNWF